MNETTDTGNHEEIATLAKQIWQAEGRQSGRDQEFWLKAEEKLRATGQQAFDQSGNASKKQRAKSKT